ncbi:hypothetical protein [Nonomuraea recticatena]|uniref:Uncharacterized protein n=1 Tax=Nonomuraea recticatena TaxID=46178 RepID=A0ABN3SAI7_9ACTN
MLEDALRAAGASSARSFQTNGTVLIEVGDTSPREVVNRAAPRLLTVSGYDDAVFVRPVDQLAAILDREAVLLKKAGESGAPPTSPSSSAIPTTGHASRLRRCSRVVSISLRKLLARVPVCDVNVHTDGFPFGRRTEPCPTDLRLSASAALPGSWTRCVRRTVI